MRLFSGKKSFRTFKLICHVGLGLTKSYKELVDSFRLAVWNMLTIFKTKFQNQILAKCNFSPSTILKKYFYIYWL